MKTICIIPARGGSKSIKKKNIINLFGKPLIFWPIKAAKKSKLVDKILVSTDNKEIANLAKEYGADVPFLRKKSLSQDNSTTEETLQNALLTYEEKNKIKYDLCVFLTCTDIFRDYRWIDEAIKILKNNKEYESVFSVNSTHKNYWKYKKDGRAIRIDSSMKKYSNRQNKEMIFREDTGLTSVSRAYLWRKGKRIGNKVKLLVNDNFETSIDIHSHFDIYLAECIIKYFKKISPDRVELFLKK